MNDIEQLLTHDAIVKTVTGYIAGSDNRRWDEVGAFLADEVVLDFSRERPDAPVQSLRREDVLKRWCSRFEKVTAYQHELSNLAVRVQGDRAVCTGNNLATHRRRDEPTGGLVLWQIGVLQEWGLKRDEKSSWVITSVRAERVWERTEPCRGAK